MVKRCELLNQNLTIQATESDKRYSRSTVFSESLFEGQTERFCCKRRSVLRNGPLSSKTVHTSRRFASVKLQQPTIFASSGPALSIVKYVVTIGLFRLNAFFCCCSALVASVQSRWRVVRVRRVSNGHPIQAHNGHPSTADTHDYGQLPKSRLFFHSDFNH